MSGMASSTTHDYLIFYMTTLQESFSKLLELDYSQRQVGVQHLRRSLGGERARRCAKATIGSIETSISFAFFIGGVKSKLKIAELCSGDFILYWDDSISENNHPLLGPQISPSGISYILYPIYDMDI